MPQDLASGRQRAKVARMTLLLSQHEAIFRFGAFAVVFAAMALWEVASPRRGRALGRMARWRTNLLLTVANSLAVRFLVPLLAVGVALWAESAHFGLFHWLNVPYALAFVLSLLALDLLIYGQHVAFHKMPWAWSFHRMHHADLDVDVTTALRFHPIEILLSMLIKMAAVALLGAPAAAVILFEVLLNACAMFNHSNVALPAPIDRRLRAILVTPDMHRVHHSVYRVEHDRNYGFCLSVWDRLFRTYLDQPRQGHLEMQTGLDYYRGAETAGLMWNLALPFETFRGKGKS